MCRNIRILFNFAPPVTEDEVRAASLQFVRKVSGFNKPSKANEAAFLAAVDGITAISTTLLNSLETSAPPRYREVEAAKARERSARRFPRQRLAGIADHPNRTAGTIGSPRPETSRGRCPIPGCRCRCCCSVLRQRDWLRTGGAMGPAVCDGKAWRPYALAERPRQFGIAPADRWFHACTRRLEQAGARNRQPCTAGRKADAIRRALSQRSRFGSGRKADSGRRPVRQSHRIVQPSGG